MQAALIAAILTTLLEVDGTGALDGVPAGHLYAALVGQVDHGEYMRLQGTLVRAGLVTVDGFHLVRLTDAGRKLAGECEAILAARKGC